MERVKHIEYTGQYVILECADEINYLIREQEEITKKKAFQQKSIEIEITVLIINRQKGESFEYHCIYHW